MQHLMLQAPRNSFPCSSIKSLELAGSGTKGVAIDRYDLQLQFGLQEADGQKALLQKKRIVKLTSLISTPRRHSLVPIGMGARRFELGMEE